MSRKIKSEIILRLNGENSQQSRKK